MTISTDFSITTGTNNIRYIGAAHAANGAGYYTVIAFHRWLQDLADDASAAGARPGRRQSHATRYTAPIQAWGVRKLQHK